MDVDVKLTQDQIVRRLRDRGLGRKMARYGSAIALCEAPTFTDPPLSNFSLVGDIDLANEKWGYSYGGFQIRSLRAEKGTGGLRDEDVLKTVKGNFDSAVAIFQTHGWSPWSTFRSGMYEAYLPDLFPVPPNIYVVIGGDTLSGIAEKLDGNWTWQDLARLNGLHEPYAIHIGDQLVIPDGTDEIP